MNPESIRPDALTSRVQRTGSAAIRPGESTGRTTGDVSFRALLDGLTQRARDLEAGANSVETPRELSGAVERSREATREAAEIADGLIELWRQSRQLEERGDARPRRA
ncbi:MAG: hypothetical protein FJ299_08470 [Planctomycetes bacterium]|nr:hypothetical protein [Planctomycetota bacterium]